MSAKGTAFITGAAQGIGKAIALRLSEDGFDVAVNDIPFNKDMLEGVVKQIQANGRKGLAVLGDVSAESDVQGMIKQIVKELDSLDVMVANAGVSMIKSLGETTVAEWDRIYGINVRGTFLCFKHAAAQMIAQGRGGKIIGACSGLSKKGAVDVSLYSSTKFAVRGIVQCAAMEYGKFGITVNGYAPGPVETALLAGLDESLAQNSGGKSGQYIETLKGLPALPGRNTSTEDVAKLVSFLVSQDADFITGQSILVDGGILFD